MKFWIGVSEEIVMFWGNEIVGCVVLEMVFCCFCLEFDGGGGVVGVVEEVVVEVVCCLWLGLYWIFFVW